MKFSLFMAVIMVVALLAGCTPSGSDSDGDSSSSATTSSQAASSDSDDMSDLIVVSSPESGDTVTSPLVVTGEARGTWYFEASFPVKLLDSNGNVLIQTYAQAQGEWMTEDFVPFVSEPLNFSAPSTPTGTLVLEKDNPSGLPENAAQIEIPVSFY